MCCALRIAALACGALLTCPTLVLATEGGQFSGPVGGSDIRSAYLPPHEGLYLSTFAGLSRGHKFTGSNGKSSPATPRGRISLNYVGLGAMYRYPGTWWGGSLASTASVYQAWNIYQRVGDTSDHQTTQTGDVYSDLLIWSRYLGRTGEAGPAGAALPYGLTIAPAMSVVAPFGSYDKDRFANIGRNAWVYAPNISFSYLADPKWSFGEGTEFSARFYYQFSGKNTDTGYRSGDVGVVDWAVTQRMGLWQAGLAGTVAKQYSDDQVDDRDVPGGNRMFVSSLGPVVNYDIPKLGAFAKLKAVYPLHEVNRMSFRFAIVQFGFKF
ncbi:transporter [Pseudomonas sp. FME51]|uniref:SphA family protein n=1 Tax=Pseudomonas sp. FME51 TaxID=2742609 RepID=UPI0018662AD4|nr:transporter [Pseudomonas sp. FME51]